MTLEGLQKTLAIKGYLNLGLSDEIKINFPGAAAPAASFDLAAVAVVTAADKSNRVFNSWPRFAGYRRIKSPRSESSRSRFAYRPVGAGRLAAGRWRPAGSFFIFGRRTKIRR